MWHDACLYVRIMHMRDMSHDYVWHDSIIIICDMTASCVIWIHYLNAMTLLYVYDIWVINLRWIICLLCIHPWDSHRVCRHETYILTDICIHCACVCMPVTGIICRRTVDNSSRCPSHCSTSARGFYLFLYWFECMHVFNWRNSASLVQELRFHLSSSDTLPIDHLVIREIVDRLPR